jgi:hypothetical protein
MVMGFRLAGLIIACLGLSASIGANDFPNVVEVIS